MANARNHIKAWFNQNVYFIFAFIAFAIPLIVRAIPEILMGQYLVGFDTIAYYVPNTLGWLNNGVNFWNLISSAPLIYILLMGITSTGASIVITLKILPPLLMGLLGIAIYYYANKALSWSPKKSLLVAMLSTMYFVALRISWDMLRSELALIFLFLALIILQKSKTSLKNGVLLSVLMFLIVFTHQLVAVIMFAIAIATLLGLYHNRKKIELRNLLICSIPAALLFFTIIYINYFVFSIPAIGFSNYFSGGFASLVSASYTALAIDTLGFLAFCYLPLVPLLLFSARRFKSNIQLKTWIIWSIIPLLLVFLSPTHLFVGSVLPYRWTMLLTYPLAFYAVGGLTLIKWNWYKVGAGLIVALMLSTLSASFLVLPNSSALSYFGDYPSYIPKSMLQNTVQLSDCQDTVNALVWARDHMPANGYLLVHEAFQGWAVLNLNSDRLLFYNFQNPGEFAQKQQESNPSNPLYLIWWVNGTGWYDQQTIPASFNELYHSGNLAIYKYSTAN